LTIGKEGVDIQFYDYEGRDGRQCMKGPGGN